MSTKKMTTVGVLCAMALALNLVIRFPMIPTVSFLNYDPKDVVIVIGGLMYGPMTSLIMSAVCSGLEIFYRGGTPLDVVMNMISTCAFACTAAWIYKHNRTKNGAVFGLAAGVIASTASMLLWNYIITPIYFQIPRETVAMMLLPGYLPFNLLKSSLNAGLVLCLYKPVATILRRSSLAEKKVSEEKRSRGMVLLGFFIALTAICVTLALQGWI